jgi:hypothetical protein
MTFWEHITGTRKLSWVDRKSHLNKLNRLIPDFESSEMRKIYLLGHAEESTSILAKIVARVQANKVWALKQVFNSLPYGEDELGLIVTGGTLSLYLLLTKSGKQLVYVLDSAADKIVYKSEAPKFFYHFLCGKSIVYPPLSLLP